ncbi:DUF2721 domain-containing protein [Sulfurirhabdus autotrophica]|uniref:Uncharacterized protein DUF2721 n=1 Tax=Sulfurirhabdus autotrophica TaxID=1706046 RepID=A0A4V2W2W2_9PROT|nr:DUF2721 domain-containing protein [Sulfurirhabdus autotrophica]TCV89609.1 uncharacterized protein DUF2721 [Sulfurirhabdus autotrophica]
MQPDTTIISIAHVIQLAVAPVFLLTGIGAILSVLVNRFARIIDRTRMVEGKIENQDATARARFMVELDVLSHRSHRINWAISLCTLSALLVCIVIATLFVGAFVVVDMSGTVALLFIAAMLALIGGLINLLREIYLVTAFMRKIKMLT